MTKREYEAALKAAREEVNFPVSMRYAVSLALPGIVSAVLLAAEEARKTEAKTSND